MALQPGLCQTWSETPQKGFITTQLKYANVLYTGASLSQCDTLFSPTQFNSNQLMLLHILAVGKPAFFICENKDADQLRGNREADQLLCFCYLDSTIPLLPKSEISSLYPYPVIGLVCVGPGWKPRRPVFSQRGSYYLSS